MLLVSINVGDTSWLHRCSSCCLYRMSSPILDQTDSEPYLVSFLSRSTGKSMSSKAPISEVFIPWQNGLTVSLSSLLDTMKRLYVMAA